MLTTQELRDLSRPSAWHTWRALAADWLGIAAILAIAARWPQPLVLVPAVVLMGRYQLALAILMHDGAHRRLFRSPRWNDAVGQWLLAGPLYFSMHSYKVLHLKHHKAPLAADDPDLSLIGGYPIPVASLRRKLLRDAVGLSYLKFIRYFVYRARQPVAAQAGARPQHERRANEKPSTAQLLASMLAANGALLAACWLAGAAWLYPVLWLLPMMTVLQVLLRIRGVAEHAGYVEGEDQRYNARTVLGSWQTWLLAPHAVHYHIEHHVYPSVPFFRLGEVHQRLRERSALPEANVFADYRAVLRSVTVPDAGEGTGR